MGASLVRDAVFCVLGDGEAPVLAGEDFALWLPLARVVLRLLAKIVALQNAQHLLGLQRHIFLGMV